MFPSILTSLDGVTLGQDGVAQHYLRELQAARQVQQKLFPCRLPRVPGWEFAAVCLPARIVSGDYYDLFELEAGQVAVALGDVSGKGLGPALVMVALHALLH